MKPLPIFFAVVLVIAAGGYWLALTAVSKMAPGLLIVQFAPMIAAFSALLISQHNLRGLGWGFGRLAYYPIALLAPLAMVAVVFALLCVFGLVQFAPDGFLGQAQTGIAQTFGWAPATLLATAAFVLIVNGTIGLVAAFPAIGEELGWRGFLAPRLAERFGFGRASLIIGVIWAVYHFPLIHFAIAPERDLASWPILLTSLAAAIGLTVILNWLRLASGSVWPAVIFHAALNVHCQGFFAQMAEPVSKFAAYAANDYGAMIAIVSGCAAIAVLVLAQGSKGGVAHEQA